MYTYPDDYNAFRTWAFADTTLYPILQQGSYPDAQAYLNDPQDSIRIPKGQMSKSDFVDQALPYMAGITDLADSACKTRWVAIRDSLLPQTETLSTDTQQYLGSHMVTDSLAMQDQMNPIISRAGSRMEEHWGVGSVANETSINRAIADAQ